MSRDQAAEIRATGVSVDVGDVTIRYLLYGLLPGWFVPGLADWVMHPHCLKGVGVPPP
ncbi:hypothetical protein ACWD1Y_20025 [Streptomyces sp. NPDC002814]